MSSSSRRSAAFEGSSHDETQRVLCQKNMRSSTVQTSSRARSSRVSPALPRARKRTVYRLAPSSKVSTSSTCASLLQATSWCSTSSTRTRLPISKSSRCVGSTRICHPNAEAPVRGRRRHSAQPRTARASACGGKNAKTAGALSARILKRLASCLSMTAYLTSTAAELLESARASSLMSKSHMPKALEHLQLTLDVRTYLMPRWPL
mmetsp:Transcript_274/g.1001  ORF Transcript_274/g.1001 Transcript_274/m.1001 type:complete len:206 (+) Transcript_274:2987-3604(+)